ncbi:MAG TPA: hypothetical protein VGK38_04350 [Prolixibacteraceae bacterium]|jgi:hypothetical protein
MPIKKYKRNSDGTYGPTLRGEFYFSKADHRRTAKEKSSKNRWALEEGEEYSVFLEANNPEPYWYCNENNSLFSFVDDCNEILGQNGERIAKFPNDRNPNDPWHGYPVLTEEKQNRPSSELLDLIQNSGFISLKVRLKIERGVI